MPGCDRAAERFARPPVRPTLFLLLSVLLPPAPVHVTQAAERVRAAGCYIALTQGVVLVESRARAELSLPFGTRRQGESPTETAARETLEETGLAVAVAEEVWAFDHGRALLYRCRPQAPPDVSRLRPLDHFEIARVWVVDPQTLRAADGRKLDLPWRYPENLPVLRQLYGAEPQIRKQP